MKPPPYIPPYFAYEQVGNLIKIYRPGKELAGIVSTFDEYLAFIRFHTERKQETYDNLRQQSAPITLDLDLEL